MYFVGGAGGGGAAFGGDGASKGHRIRDGAGGAPGCRVARAIAGSRGPAHGAGVCVRRLFDNPQQ